MIVNAFDTLIGLTPSPQRVRAGDLPRFGA